MKKHFLPLFALCLFATCASAQKLPKPTQLPNSLTDAQQQTLQLGIKLHDTKQYDSAIAAFDKILVENPDAAEVIYEKALSLYTKGDKEKAMAAAYGGAKYKSDQLALFYTIMANCLDDVGKSDEAINIYRQAEDMLKSDVGVKHHLSSVYYNLGLTYVRQKKYTEARTELKKAIENNYAYASPHYMLAIVYNGTKYKVPAFLAAARFVALEFNTDRTARGAAVIADVLKPGSKDPKTGNINIFLNLDAPKDEGDFGMYELLLGTLTTVKGDKDKDKTDNEMFVDALGSLIAMVGEDKNLKSTFVGKNYIPFVNEMKAKGFVAPFAYLVLYHNGNKEALNWITANDSKMMEFVNWAKAYQLPQK